MSSLLAVKVAVTNLKTQDSVHFMLVFKIRAVLKNFARPDIVLDV